MSKSRFPDPLTLLVGCIVLATILSYLLPAGQYDRREDPSTGRQVVVAGSYHRVDPSPVAAFDMVVAIPRGLAAAADVVFLVFLIGGAFTVVDRTGALRAAVESLIRRLRDRDVLVIPVVAIPFAIGGTLENMQEEIIPLIPVLLIVARRLGFSPLTAVSMSAGAAFVGSAFSPINPFQVGIAQKLAQLPLLSGGGYRTLFLLVALAGWIWATMRHATRTRLPVEAIPEDQSTHRSTRSGLVLAIVAVTFGILIYGISAHGWDFDHLSALFLIMGIVVGFIGGLGLDGTVRAYVDGFRGMAYAAILIGFARAIFVVLEQGRIIDTIVHGLFTPLAGLPVALSALGMMAAHVALHFPVPSVSGHAVLTMPVLVPLSDLLGLSRQVTVLAYQYGAGVCELITPTNGALMAILAAAGVRFDDWIRFVIPRVLALWALATAAIVLGTLIGL